MTMTSDQLSLAPFYKGWDVFQDYLSTAVAPLTDEQLTLRVATHQRSVGELATHIIDTRAGWFHELMGEGGDDLAALAVWGDEGMPVRNAAELVSGLETTWHTVQDALTRWTPADLDYVFEGVRGTRAYRFTRQWVIWHVIEHDLFHGGEMLFTMGAHGLATPDL
jgi:uncharacterized damage-inducible protein DinB